MKKKIFSLILALTLCFGLTAPALAADDEAVSAAEALHAMGLFNGTGTTPDGTPSFDLDRAPTRHEAVTMLVRLLGKEDEARSRSWDLPFADVAEWARPYVGYAYASGLTAGTSAAAFGGDSTVSAAQYITFVLRSLGYQSGSDFQWDSAWELSDKIGLTDGRYHAGTTEFTRGDVALISYRSLGITKNDVPAPETISTPESRIETIHYVWECSGYDWTYDLKISPDVVAVYKRQPRQPIYSETEYLKYVSEPSDDEYLHALARVFLNTAENEGWGTDGAVKLAVSFVQSLKYTPDDINLGYDYPKYPLETLYDQGGDCEDTSILLVSLIKEMGYGCCLLIFDDHMGVGILGDRFMYGTYFAKYGERYFYVETTSTGWDIGELPDELWNKKATVWIQ